MKTLARTLLIACTLAVPAISFAQTVDQQGPVTRAEVRADLIRLEHAGYRPGPGDDSTYPADIQAAEAKVAAQERLTSMNAQPQASALHLVAMNSTHHYRIDDARSVYTDGA